MNLQQLLSIPDLDFAIFEEVLEEQYGYKDASHYKEVLQEMFMLELSPDADTTLCYWFTSHAPDEPEDYPVYEVSLFRDDDDADKESYACDMVPWNELLAYSVDVLIQEWVNTHQMLVEEVLAHIIYEITFYGMTEKEVKEKRDNLLTILEDPNLPTFQIPDNDELLADPDKYIPLAEQFKPADEELYGEDYVEKMKEILEQVKKDIQSGEIKNYPTHEDVFGDTDGDELNENS